MPTSLPRGRRRILAAVALTVALAAPAQAGTYSFSFQESIVDARLAGPAVHGTFAAGRDYADAVAGWHGPRLRTVAGGHTAGAFAMLDLAAPSPARFVQSSLVVRYRGCGKESGGFWMEASVLLGTSEALGTRRSLPAPPGCVEVAAERPGAGTLTRPDRIRLKLGSTRADASHVSGTSVLVNQVSGTIEDTTAPALTVTAAGAPTTAARTVSWTAADGQAGPRTVAVRVTGPGGFAAALVGWEGAATPNRACLAGQFITGCQTSVARAAAVTLPAVTGTYSATVTATDGAGNATVRTVALERVAPPTVLAAPALTGVAQVGRTLTLTGGGFGNGPTATAFAFWRRQGSVITLVRAANADPTYTVVRADHGAVIVGRAVATNAAGSATAEAPASAVVLPALPAGGTPVLDGLPAVVDRPLAVAPGSWDNGGAPGAPAVTAIRWFACTTACALVGRDARYVPGADDVGRALVAEVDVANAAGAATATSARTAPVVPGEPAFLAPPAVAGPARVGETLTTAAPAVAGHGAAVTVTVAWLGCADAEAVTCTRPVGAGVAHLTAEAERGLRLRVRATATSAGGTAIAWSAPTEPVLGRNECLLVAPGRITACVGASSRVTLEARLDRPAVLAGRAAVVSGRLTVAGDVTVPAAVTVAHGGRAALAAVDGAGAFALPFAPTLSERVTVAVRIAGRSEPLQLDAGEVRVTPLLTARFTVRRDRFGTVRDLRVTGTAVPTAPVPGLRLLLEGRTPQGRVVGLICRAAEQPVVREGRFAGRCRSRFLPRAARYRVRFLPGPASPLDAAITPWRRASLR